MAEIKRLYNIFFEDRDIRIIYDDFHAKRWISKKELLSLYENDKLEMLAIIKSKQEDYELLLSNFSLGSFNTYQVIEEKYQGLLPKKPI